MIFGNPNIIELGHPPPDFVMQRQRRGVTKSGGTNRRAVVVAVFSLFLSACSSPTMRPGTVSSVLPIAPSQEQQTPPAPTKVVIESPADPHGVESIDPQEGKPFTQPANIGNGVKLDFDAVDVQEFVQVIAESLGLNYTIDPAVTGQITVHTGQTLNGPQLYAAFREILKAQGYGIRNQGTLAVIVPEKGAKKRYDLAGLHVRFIPINNAPVSTMTTQLQQAIAAFDPQHEAVTVVPLEQMQSIMILTPDEIMVDTVAQWALDLDTIPADSRQGIYLYNVRCGLASDLSRLVNSLLYSATVASAPQSINPDSDKPQTNIAPSIPSTINPTLIPDDSRNVVLIHATNQEFNRITKLLEQLDTTPRQVLIDVLVAEVTLGKSLDFGVEWALKNNQLKIGDSSYRGVVSTSFNGLAATATNGLAATIFNSSSDPVAVVNALAAQTDVTLISSPQIFVQNNEQATVNVGDRVPVVVSETNQTNVDTPTVDRQVQYFDTGTILKVTPRINHDGLVSLDVFQQVSQATQNQTSAINSPVISTREVKTKLTVRDGQPIMLGGLISRGNTKKENKVPFLGDIPGLGVLFRYNGTEQKRTELLVMITPHVVYSDGLDAYQAHYRAMAQDLESRLHNQIH